MSRLRCSVEKDIKLNVQCPYVMCTEIIRACYEIRIIGDLFWFVSVIGLIINGHVWLVQG